MPAFRPVLVVARAPGAQLLQALHLHGWDPVHVGSLDGAAGELRTRRFPVTLLLLEGEDPAGAARRFEDCLLVDAGTCEWVGVFPPWAVAAGSWREHILAHFFDHHVAPAEPAALCQTLEHAWARAALRDEQVAEGAADSDLGMVGRSPELERLRRDILKGGPAEAPVLVSGESGTGKELIARALHACSRRRGGPFVAVNCGALPPTLIHSELFGHERGSFSGAVNTRHGLIESAGGGTLFLDEIAELPLESQAMLLRFLQEGRIQRVGSGTEIRVGARVIAASHVDLAQAMAAGSFRHDLYFRLNVLALHVPPLRERREDIPLLARHVLAHISTLHAASARGFHSAAMAAMMTYGWPGNVRELINRVQRAALMSEHSLIRAEDLDLPSGPPAEKLHSAREGAEKVAIRQSLERSGQNLAQAARELGVSRMTLYRLLAKHSIILSQR